MLVSCLLLLSFNDWLLEFLCFFAISLIIDAYLAHSLILIYRFQVGYFIVAFLNLFYLLTRIQVIVLQIFSDDTKFKPGLIK